MCTKTMSVKGGVYDNEAYGAKKIKIFFWLCEYITPTSFLHIYILLLPLYHYQFRCIITNFVVSLSSVVVSLPSVLLMQRETAEI